MKHEAKRFVEKLDYLTSPGWLYGGDSREKAGFKRGGPIAVVTNLGIMKFDDVSKEMYLAEYYKFTNPEEIASATGFKLDISRARITLEPSEDELTILHTQVDPQRLILG